MNTHLFIIWYQGEEDWNQLIMYISIKEEPSIIYNELLKEGLESNPVKNNEDNEIIEVGVHELNNPREGETYCLDVSINMRKWDATIKFDGF